MSSIKRADIVKAAMDWLDVPYRHQGRTRNGVDCVGVLFPVARMLGLEVKINDLRRYGNNPETYTLKQELDRHLIQIPDDCIFIGDVLLFKIDVDPQHVGIVCPYSDTSLGLIHCYSSVGKVVKHRLSRLWRARIVQAYQVPGVGVAK